MAGTVFVGAEAQFDVRGVDFAWIAAELRKRTTDSNRDALSAALWAYEEAAMDMLHLDRLSAEDFHMVGLAFDDMTSHLRTTRGNVDLLLFLDRVRGAIHCDSRWPARAINS